MVKKKSFLDVIGKPVIIAATSVYLASITSLLLFNILNDAKPLIRNDILWQNFIFPPAMFLIGWVLAKLWKQPKPILAGAIFMTSTLLLSYLTWWLWSWLFGFFLWPWWNGLSSMFVQIISAALIQLIVTVFVFRKRTMLESERSQIYTIGLITAVVVMELVYAVRGIPHILLFSSQINPGGLVYAISILTSVLEFPFIVIVAGAINFSLLRNISILSRRLTLSTLFAFYTILLTGSLSYFAYMFRLRDPTGLWIVIVSWVIALGLNIWAMLYFRRHLPLRKG